LPVGLRCPAPGQASETRPPRALPEPSARGRSCPRLHRYLAPGELLQPDHHGRCRRPSTREISRVHLAQAGIRSAGNGQAPRGTRGLSSRECPASPARGPGKLLQADRRGQCRRHPPGRSPGRTSARQGCRAAATGSSPGELAARRIARLPRAPPRWRISGGSMEDQNINAP
jgi:hypothetical protein